MTKTAENLQELRAMREMITPEHWLDDTDTKCEQNLSEMRAIREMISPFQPVSDEKREEHLSYIDYLNQNVRSR